MDVLFFESRNVKITAATSAKMESCWRRFRARVPHDASTYCDYRSTLSGILRLALPSSRFDLQQIGTGEAREWRGYPPVFYETATYNLTLYFTDVENPPCIIHKLKDVVELFTVLTVGENQWLVSAPMSFLNQPGIFDLTFRYKPVGEKERTEAFSFRVVSPKLDTKDDYNKILAEVNAEYNEIIYQYLTLTLQNLRYGGKSDNDIVWLSIFRNVVQGYEKWVRYIVNKPHLRQSREVHHEKPDRIKRWTPRQSERFAEVRANGRVDREYFRNEEIIHTHNTRENRFVKFTLERISRRLTTIVATIKAKQLKARKSDMVTENELAELDGYISSIRRLGNSSLLRNLRGEPLRSESMVLQKRTGYAQVYKHWLLLQKGIEFYEGSTNIGVRPIWELYELWCFLKIRQMVADILGLHFDNPDEIQENPMPMVKPFEDNAREHTVFYDCEDGSKVRLHYQHTYNRRSGEVRTATTENRPDIVLTIIRPDGFELTYLFDAKYRLLDDNKLNKEEAAELTAGIDYPPADAINQMHRYRDAIYYQSERQKYPAKEIIGGYILYPGRMQGQLDKEPYFIESIRTVNIGAFPLLPNAADPENEGALLRQFLRQILTAPRLVDHLHSAIPQKGLAYHEANRRAPNELVLVGYYKTQQWGLIEKNRLYYVPAALGKGSINLVSGFENTRYLLLHHGTHRRLVALTGDGPRFFPKTALEQLGFRPTSGDYFLGFDIASMHPVPGVDPYRYSFERKGQGIYRPYFTTIDKLLAE